MGVRGYGDTGVRLLLLLLLLLLTLPLPLFSISDFGTHIGAHIIWALSSPDQREPSAAYLFSSYMR